ncbi:OmpA family protein [bacterium]|nr:OmpA family protein [bacterium]
MTRIVSFLVFLFIGQLAFGQNAIYKLEGSVTDVQTMEPLGNIKVSLLNTNDTNVLVRYTNNTGFYQFETDQNGQRLILPNTSYTIEVSGMDEVSSNDHRYLPSKGQETTKGVLESTAFIKDFELMCADCLTGEGSMPRIYFEDCESMKIQDSALINLNYLHQVLMDNPTIILEVSPHCSCYKNESQNVECSAKRGEEVAEKLINLGIEKERLVLESYGSERPTYIDSRVINKTPLNDRVGNTVYFSILSFDYINKGE